MNTPRTEADRYEAAALDLEMEAERSDRLSQDADAELRGLLLRRRDTSRRLASDYRGKAEKLRGAA